ncbi:MAG TPA: hypothetical protein VHE35_16470 [Kofleriaceae bacterium]|nr:hypothetical protein [Kofleriaceae bacterium]
MSSRAVAIAARVVAIALPVAAGALGLAAPWSVLWGGAAWLAFLVAVLAGWGHLAARAARTDADLGLRLVWGTAALLAVAGVLVAAGVCDRHALAALLAIGLAAHAWRELTVARPSILALADQARALARDPQLAVLYGALAALLVVNVLGAVVQLHGNVYDDDVAYTPFVKRLLDIGNLDEPFSFRRISAFGGQTVLSALAAVRGTLGNLYLVDRGLFQLVTVLLVVGLVRRRGADRFVGALVVLVLLLLPEGSINTASYWSGAALFLGLYRTITDADDAPRAAFALAGLVAAATCSLRQNYLPVAVGFVGLCLLFRLRRPLGPALRRDRAAWLAAIVGVALPLAPWLAASWRANHTFLYPFQLGTFNPSIQMTPTVWTGWQELQFFLKVLLEPDPIRIALPLLPVLLVMRDRRPGRPLTALTLASVGGFLLLVHTFALSDAKNLWRYAFGFAAALTALLALEGSRPAERDAAAPVGLPAVARLWVIACLLAQLASTGKSTAHRYARIGDDLAAAARTHGRADTDLAMPALHRRLQASAPAGAAIAVLLDQPAYLDYARNRIYNLDVPGYASLPPGMPYFRGAEPVAAYFRGVHIRYLAFVRGDRSRYFFRRAFWVERLLFDTELWRIMGAYVVDTLDTFAELATRYRVLFDEGGLVMVDLATPAGGAP